MQDFGAFVKLHRIARGLLQEELAIACGVTRGTISNWERSVGFPKALKDRVKFERLVEALGLSTDQQRELRTALAGAEIDALPQDYVPAPVRPPTPLLYFEKLDRYLSRPSLQFPRLADFEAGLVCLRQDQTANVKHFLTENRCCLLVGPSAAGKSVLAIAVARSLQETDGYVAFYADVARAMEGDGRLWYQFLQTNDRRHILCILDNCHYRPDEVSEFCFQWTGDPPKHAQVILISWPDTEFMNTPEAALGDYFDLLADVVIEIKPEQVYRDIIKRYTEVFQQDKPGFYVDPDNNDAALLEAQHAHDLVVSRTRLQTWQHQGGKLSEVSPEAVYEALIRNYLSMAVDALPALCALWQFEIPAHNEFVEHQLPQSQIAHLRSAHILAKVLVPDRGVIYPPPFHAALAREILHASVYRNQGCVSHDHVENKTSETLKLYLQTKPPDYAGVYWRLLSQRQAGILTKLLGDRELQACACDQFAERKLHDAFLYLGLLSSTDAPRARQLLQVFIEMSGPERIGSSLVKSSVQTIWRAMQFLQRIMSPQQAAELYASIPTETWAEKAPRGTRASIASIQAYLDILYYLRKLDLPSARVNELAELVDTPKLVARGQGMGLVSLFWFVRSLRAVSQKQAKAVLEGFPEDLLAAKMSAGDMTITAKLLTYLQEWGYPQDRLQVLVTSIDSENVARRLQEASLQRLYWLLRAIAPISLELASALLDNVTPARLADICRKRQATTENLRKICQYGTRRFRKEFMACFSVEEMAIALQRSRLVAAGYFLRYEYGYVAAAYSLFREQFLPAKLAAEPLAEIAKFIYQLRQVPKHGDHLVRGVLDHLPFAELSDRIANADVEGYALLLDEANAVNTTQAVQLLAMLSDDAILTEALARSSIRGIQLLIHAVAAISGSEQHLVRLRGILKASDLTEKMAEAEIADLGYFLWNVFALLDRELAVEYCRIVDNQGRSERLKKALPQALSAFLWNLIQVSDTLTLRTLALPVIEQCVVSAWKLHVGQGANLLGVVTTAHPTILARVELPSIEAQDEDQLGKWFVQAIEQGHPYVLAHTLRGLGMYDAPKARVLSLRYLPIRRASSLLDDALKSAITRRSTLLLQETLDWLARLPDHGK